MTAQIRRLPQARIELSDAAAWYEQQKPGLGDDFLAFAEIIENAIMAMPESWAIFPEWGDRQPAVRSHRMGKYPYRVVFYMEGATVVIVAYAHTAKDPGYWMNRVA